MENGEWRGGSGSEEEEPARNAAMQPGCDPIDCMWLRFN